MGLEAGEESDFGVSEEGEVSPLKHLSLAGREEEVLVVYARDLQTKQVWKTRVHILVRPNGNKVGTEQVKQQWKLNEASGL